MPARYAINALLTLGAILLGQLLISNAVITRYQTGVLEQVGIYIIVAVSLNVATGYLGQLPLGHAGFMSIGGYSCSILIMRLMLVLGVGMRDFVTATPAACALFVGGVLFGGVMAAVAGIIIGVPALRLKGDYLAIITLGFAEIIRVVMLNIDGVVNFELTNDTKDLTGIPSYTSFMNTFVVVAIGALCLYAPELARIDLTVDSVSSPRPISGRCGRRSST